MKRFTPTPADPLGQPVGPVVDVHQHRWPEALVEALRRRARPPRLDGWTLHLPGEPAYDVDPGAHDRGQRRKQDLADDLDTVLLSLSSPLGVEHLAADEAEPLLAAWHGVLDEPADPDGPAYAVWAAPALAEPDPPALARLLARPGVCGLQVPATALADPGALERTTPLLAVAEAAGVPVLVHPGPALGRHDVPAWWPALTAYPAQLAAAWFAWRVAGRALLPTLRIGFAALAGLAPLHHERLEARGGVLGPIDTGVFYDTSSYGTRAVDAITRVVGVDPLVHGSDRPYAVPRDPGLGGAFGRALFVSNPARFLEGAAR